MIIDFEKLVEASSVSQSDGVIELELEGKAQEVVTAYGEIIFICRFCDSVVICIGNVVKYEEVPESEAQDLFARLYIKGHSISFTL